MARKSAESQVKIQQLEIPELRGIKKPKRRIKSSLAPVGDEELDQKDLRADGVHLNYGGMSEKSLRNWRSKLADER